MPSLLTVEAELVSAFAGNSRLSFAALHPVFAAGARAPLSSGIKVNLHIQLEAFVLFIDLWIDQGFNFLI